MSKTGKKEKINLTEGSPTQGHYAVYASCNRRESVSAFLYTGRQYDRRKNPGDFFSGGSRGYKHYRIFCAVLYSGNDKWFWHLPGTESRGGEAGRDQKRSCGISVAESWYLRLLLRLYSAVWHIRIPKFMNTPGDIYNEAYRIYVYCPFRKRSHLFLQYDIQYHAGFGRAAPRRPCTIWYFPLC